MNLQETIKLKLQEALSPSMLDIVNESHMHAGPASESHYKVTIVCDEFTDKTLITRHRIINNVLAEELNGKIHALALHTYTPGEYLKRAGSSPESPKCEGGSGA